MRGALRDHKLSIGAACTVLCNRRASTRAEASPGAAPVATRAGGRCPPAPPPTAGNRAPRLLFLQSLRGTGSVAQAQPQVLLQVTMYACRDNATVASPECEQQVGGWLGEDGVRDLEKYRTAMPPPFCFTASWAHVRRGWHRPAALLASSSCPAVCGAAICAQWARMPHSTKCVLCCRSSMRCWLRSYQRHRSSSCRLRVGGAGLHPGRMMPSSHFAGAAEQTPACAVHGLAVTPARERKAKPLLFSQLPLSLLQECKAWPCTRSPSGRRPRRPPPRPRPPAPGSRGILTA